VFLVALYLSTYRPQTRSLSFAQLPSLSIGQNWAGNVVDKVAVVVDVVVIAAVIEYLITESKSI